MNEFRTTEDILQEIKQILENMLKCAQQNNRIEADWDFINAADLCRVLGVTKRTIGTLKANGIIGSTKIGGLVLFKKSEVKKVLENNFSKIMNDPNK